MAAGDTDGEPSLPVKLQAPQNLPQLEANDEWWPRLADTAAADRRRARVKNRWLIFNAAIGYIVLNLILAVLLTPAILLSLIILPFPKEKK